MYIFLLGQASDPLCVIKMFDGILYTCSINKEECVVSVTEYLESCQFYK